MCHFEIAIGRHAPVDIAADGVILSSPTGSTAYALSAGGPVITPDCPVLQLTPIAAHSLASRALVFSDQEPVTVFPATPERLSEAVQWIDSKMIPAGRSNPLAALEAAMVLKPEIIFLLSADITGAGDYEISEKTLMEALDRMNPRDPATHNRPVRIQCVQFLDPDPSGTLERLAREHGGADGYRYLGRKELGLDNNQE